MLVPLLRAWPDVSCPSLPPWALHAGESCVRPFPHRCDKSYNTRVGYDRVRNLGVHQARSRVTHTAQGRQIYGPLTTARLAERVSRKVSERRRRSQA